MKLIKKALVLVLAAAIILLAACDNGNGGGGTSGSGEYVPPTLPERKGDDPFAGLETLSTDDQPVHYRVDTEKKTLTKQSDYDGTGWSNEAEYSYSYDGTVTPPTVTVKIDSALDPNGELVAAENYLAVMKSDLEKSYSITLDTSINGTEEDKREMIEYLKITLGVDLTLDDLTHEKKDATLEKMMDSPGTNRSLSSHLLILNTAATYAVEAAGGWVSFTGQHDPNLPWYQQPAGYFRTEEGHGISSIPAFVGYSGYFVISANDNTIKLQSSNFTEKECPYTTTGSGEDMIVAVDIDGSEKEFTWCPATELPRMM